MTYTVCFQMLVTFFRVFLDEIFLKQIFEKNSRNTKLTVLVNGSIFRQTLHHIQRTTSKFKKKFDEVLKIF